MPKMKSHSGAKKRFMISSNGNVKRAQKGKNHILTKKSRKTKRNLRKTTYLEGAQAQTVKKMIVR
jgi:large subunit ribosomal protein L35